MNVFLTGGTGLIGSAVVAELLANDHSVLALARSEASALALKSAGAEPVRGDLADLDALRSGAAGSDGVIHLAFSHDFSSPDAIARAVAEESSALATLGEELLGSDRPFVTVSGTPPVPGRVSTEADPLPTNGPVGGRSRSVMAVLDLASHGVRSSAVRMPRTVHNQGDGGFAGMLTQIARRTGVSGYPGDGTQRWPAVHALDAAVLLRLALERAEAGTSWHAVADEGDAGAGHRRSHRPAARAASRDGASGNLRSARPDLRHRPARLQHPHTEDARLGTDTPEPPRGPREHPGLTNETESRDRWRSTYESSSDL